MVLILGASAPTVQGRAKARVDISFLDVNADDDLSFYSVNRDRQGNALINLAASQRRHNELMSPIMTHAVVYSAVTLALFEDSGWYVPDYTARLVFSPTDTCSPTSPL